MTNDGIGKKKRIRIEKDIVSKNNLKKLADISDGFVVSNIGQLDYFKDIKTNLIANYTFNIFNNYTLKNIEELGFSKAILSPELTNEQINNLTSGILKEAIVYGNQCVMTSEHCPTSSQKMPKFTSSHYHHNTTNSNNNY